MHISRIAGLVLFALSLSLTAEASRIMYNGFSPSPAKSPEHFQGFTAESTAIQPSTSTYLVLPPSPTSSDPLSLPSCFAGVPTILPVPGPGGKDASVRYSFAGASGSGAKVLTLADNCQTRTGELHFRFLFRAEQAVFDAMQETSFAVPDRQVSESCGILWSTFDYNHACKTNSNVRYTQNQFAVGTTPGKVADNTANITFCRGFMVDLMKSSATHSNVLRLHVWGKDATDFASDAKSIILSQDIVGGKTYLCHVRIEINHYKNGDERLVGFVQPVDDYDPSCGWAGAPFVRSIRADIVGDDGKNLIANLVLQGISKNVDGCWFDEMGLATAAEDLSVITFNDAKFAEVLAYDGLPCGSNAYPSDADKAVGSTTVNFSGNEFIRGFSSFWAQYYVKSSIVLKGDGTGLPLPDCYAQHGVLSCSGTSIGYSAKPTQGLYLRRSFNSNLLALKTGDVLHLRCLLAANTTALGSLVAGPDLNGGLIAGTPGVQESVNYFGAGIGDCSVQVETNQPQESHAPTLCRRARSCFFTFTMRSDNTFGLYLNLLTEADGTPVAYKIKDVPATFEGTVFCYARIEVGTGTNGKERIMAFAEDVTKITDQAAANWIPSEPGQFIEHELISDTAYPLHAMVGGKAHTGFRFDEFGLELGKNPIAFAWAKRPSGLLMLFR